MSGAVGKDSSPDEEAGKPSLKKTAPVGLLGRIYRRGWVRWTGVGGIVLMLGGFAILTLAEHQTSKPSFCGSCHVMTPYYESWQADVHGEKHGVACVECHYAPGQQTTMKAKFRGLSQLLSYTTGRYGQTRPRAHVSNDSCLTSKCHGDLKFMDKPLWVGTVRFIHAHHLQTNGKQTRANDKRLAELRKTLGALVGAERTKELESVACQSGAAQLRYTRMVEMCAEWAVSVDSSLLEELSQLHHRPVRLAQLGDLQCTSCHSYGGHEYTKRARAQNEPHFSVNTNTCFTCHFRNEAFNTGTGRCLSCHTLPTQEITVHKEMDAGVLEKLKMKGMPTKPIKMDHAEILARKVKCISCHADLSQERMPVSRRDCQHCHDQKRYFKDWTLKPSLEVVTRYHRQHIQDQRATCLDCHSEISHMLRGEDSSTPGQEFLPPALGKCTYCHPSHHQEQVKMLLGQGGKGVPDSDPNPMFGSRTNCYGCHTGLGADAKGQNVMSASEKSCLECHGEQYGEMFEQWKEGVQMSLVDAEEIYERARKALDENTTASAESRKKAADSLALAESDLHLVKRANGIHNVTYAIELLDAVTTHSRQAMAALEEE